MSERPVRVLVAGLGNMGRSHALAYHLDPGYEIVGRVSRGGRPTLPELGAYPHWTDFQAALAQTRPDLPSINTYSDSHAAYAIAAMELGAHVFVEKPLAPTVEDAPRVVETTFFVKDVISPKGSVSIAMEAESGSTDMDTHTKTSRIRRHFAALRRDGRFQREDEWTSTADEPGHDALCARELRAVDLQA